LKLYTYKYKNDYYITDRDPKLNEKTNDIYGFTSSSSKFMEPLGIDRIKWEQLIIKYNGNIISRYGNKIFDSKFKSKKDAENFLKELEPYIILSEIIGDEYK